jgi:hypothetical protein
MQVDGTDLVDIITPNGDAAATTFNPFNNDINTVRGQESGYATLNSLDPRGLGNSPTFSEGNLRINHSSSYDVVSTIGADSGRWYWEVEMIDVGTTICGIIDIHNGRSSQFSMTSPTVYYATTRMNGTREGNQSGGTNFTYTDGDLVAWALDVDNLKLYGYKNGILMSTATITQSDVKWAPYVYGESTTDHRFNFGQKPFKFPPPDGFQPLNTANTRPETVISRPDQYVGATTYSGSTGTGTIKDDNINFTPDFVWVKDRGGTEVHALYDTVRGSTGGNFYRLSSNNTNGNNSPTNELTSMIRGGFTANNNGHIYYNGKNYVSWMWKAGGNKNTFNVDDVGYASAAAAGLPTESGGISVSACSVGTKQGFSIIKYGGGGNGENGIPHGLGRVPKFYIVKNISSNSSYWTMYHVGMGNTKGIYFDSDGANTNDWWDNTTPTEDLFYVKQASLYVHNGSDDYISYLWCDVPGLQKFGTYEGNNNSDGPFVELGFNPAIIWTKGIDSSSHGWEVHWNSGPSLRQNPQSERLMLNENAAKATTNHVDFLSNGFKIRNTFSGMNNTTDTYIYCAWADVPSIDLYGGGANAR